MRELRDHRGSASETESTLRLWERAAYDRINALFAWHDDRGNCAYCILEVSEEGALELAIECPEGGFPKRPGWSQVFAYHYRTLRGGRWRDPERPEGQQSEILPLSAAVERSVRAAAAAWPNHRRLQVVWRLKPEIMLRDGRHDLYMRLVATPVV